MHLQVTPAARAELELAHYRLRRAHRLGQRSLDVRAPDHLEGGAAFDGAPGTEQLAQPWIRQDHPTLLVEHEHALDHALEHGAQPRLLVAGLREPPPQLLGHVVDRARDRAELVARAPRQALREVPGGDGLHHAA